MRLIDADALKTKLQARYDNGDEDFDKGYNIGIETAIDLIDNAPTVNPEKPIFSEIWYQERPQGKWEKCQNDMFRCSNCGQADEVPIAMGTPIYNFCPNCGADMRGEKNE